MKRLSFAVFLICSLLLSGCQLAKEGESEVQTHDRLIGVMITEEHLDLFDMEAYLNDHASDFFGDKDAVIEDSAEYNQRIYADMEHGNCVFEGVEGILYAAYEYEGENERGSRMPPNEGISDGHVFVKEDENSTFLTLEGTIYLDDRIGEYGFYYNPVYQDPQGNVYLTGGNGFFGNILEGGSMHSTHSLSEDFEVTEGSRTQSYRTEVSIAVAAVRLPEKYVLVSMDENHQEIAREEFTPDALPEEISPAEGAAYLLVESHSTTSEGLSHIIRTIHSPDDENKSLDVFAPLENGICVKGSAKICWPEE